MCVSVCETEGKYKHTHTPLGGCVLCVTFAPWYGFNDVGGETQSLRERTLVQRF